MKIKYFVFISFYVQILTVRDSFALVLPCMRFLVISLKITFTSCYFKHNFMLGYSIKTHILEDTYLEEYFKDKNHPHSRGKYMFS